MIHPPGMSSFKTAFEAAVAREKWLDEHPEIHDMRNVLPDPENLSEEYEGLILCTTIIITKQERREMYNYG